MQNPIENLKRRGATIVHQQVIDLTLEVFYRDAPESPIQVTKWYLLQTDGGGYKKVRRPFGEVLRSFFARLLPCC